MPCSQVARDSASWTDTGPREPLSVSVLNVRVPELAYTDDELGANEVGLSAR